MRPGEPIGPTDIPGLGGAGAARVPSAPVTTLVGSAPQANATIGGSLSGSGILGVASLNKDKSLRMFNGRTKYSEWLFVAGQPRLVGRQFGPAVAPNPFPDQRQRNPNQRQPSNNR